MTQHALTHDTAAFWTAVLLQPAGTDTAGRDLVKVGDGAAGPILCTKEYAENRRRLVRSRSAKSASVRAPPIPSESTTSG